MNQDKIRQFIHAIPKTDLHVHLDGSLRLPTLIELAREQKVELPSYEEDGLRETVFKSAYRDLPEYLAGFQYTCAVMQNAESLERIAFELAEDNIAEGVRYVEVRFAPQLHIHDDLDCATVLTAVARGLKRAKDQHDAARTDGDIMFHYGIIVCALRYFNPHMSAYYRRLFDLFSYLPDKEKFGLASEELVRASVHLRDEENLPIVGFDLAGAEAGFPAVDHREAFRLAHIKFLKKTVHAGEAYGPESIFQAITECYANRIGHGTFLLSPDRIKSNRVANPDRYVHQLTDYIATQRITIEVNLTSNLQTTPSIETPEAHPLRAMLDNKLSVSLCTDNRLVSHTTVSRELLLAIETLQIKRLELKNMVIAGFKGSFFPSAYADKRCYVRDVLTRYEALEEEAGPLLPE